MHRQERHELTLAESASPGIPLLRCRFLERGARLFANAALHEYPMPALSRFYLLRAGNAAVHTAAGQTVTLYPDRLYLLPLNLTFTVEFEAGCSLLYFHLLTEGADGRDVFDGAPFQDPPAESASLCERILAGCDRHDDLGDRQWQSALFEGVCDFSHRLPVPPWKRSTRFRALVEYVRGSPLHHLRIPALAEIMGMKPAALARGFRREMGLPLKVFLIRTSLAEARERLAETDASVRQIAQHLGYDDPSYFNRIFAKHVGVSPREYRLACVSPGELLVP